MKLKLVLLVIASVCIILSASIILYFFIKSIKNMKQYYSLDIDSHHNNLPVTNFKFVKEVIPGFPKIIWILWFQGFNNMHYVVKNVIQSWKKYNPDWEIIILTKENLSDYIFVKLKSTQTFAAQSDIIRLKLLSTYGGVWADATLICMQPLNNWIYNLVLPAKFWMYHGRDNGKGGASWFIVSSKFSPLINEWNLLAEDYWSNRDSTDDYFWMDMLFENQRKNFVNSIISKEWEKVPFINCEYPGSAHYLAKKVDKKLSKDIITKINTINLPFVIKLNRSIEYTDIPTKIKNGHYIIHLTKTKDIVIAHCKENLDWLINDNISNMYNIIYIYTKCDSYIPDIIKQLPNIVIINLKNVGQESNTYLYHIITKWDVLADYTVFITGNPIDQKRKNFYNNIVKNSFVYKNNYNMYSDSFIPMNFHIDRWQSSNHHSNSQKLQKSRYNNLYNFCETIFGHENADIIQNSSGISYCGAFIVGKDCIKYNSINLYRNLFKESNIGTLNEIAHFIERLWVPIMENKIKYKLGILALFKNESHIFDEWIDFYLKEGVEKFYLINNISTDNFYNKLGKKSYINIYNDRRNQSQVSIYNTYLRLIKKECDWIMIIDFDEFIYGRNNKKLIDILDGYDDNVGQLQIRMKMFGSNGHIKQPKSVINSFKLRQKLLPNTNGDNFKSIIRTKYLSKINIHKSDVENCKTITIPKNRIESEFKLASIGFNHYIIQSKEWFENVKITRGDCVYKKNVRDLNYFKEHDFKDIFDDELANKYNQNNFIS